MVRIGSLLQLVQYKGISTLCFKCGCVGRKAQSCPTVIRPLAPPSPTLHPSPSAPDANPNSKDTEDSKPFGDWMISKNHKSRKQWPTCSSDHQSAKPINPARHEILRLSCIPSRNVATLAFGASSSSQNNSFPRTHILKNLYSATSNLANCTHADNDNLRPNLQQPPTTPCHAKSLCRQTKHFLHPPIFEKLFPRKTLPKPLFPFHHPRHIHTQWTCTFLSHHSSCWPYGHCEQPLKHEHQLLGEIRHPQFHIYEKHAMPSIKNRGFPFTITL